MANRYKLAELLLRRKELEGKVAQLHQVQKDATFKALGKRVRVTDEIDDLMLQVPLLSAKEVTAEYDFYASQLRRCDALIQQTNWTVEVESEHDLTAAFEPREDLLVRNK